MRCTSSSSLASFLAAFLAVLALSACHGGLVDADGDGWSELLDCDDHDDVVYPGAHQLETPGDGVDQDCDGQDACADLGCDAWPDLVVSQSSVAGDPAAGSSLFLGSNDGFSTEGLPSVGASGIALSDWNQDGYLDIALAAAGTTDDAHVDSTFYPGSFNGNPATARVPLGTVGASSVTFADLDGDGLQDLVFANAGPDGLDSMSSVDSVVFWAAADGFVETRVSTVETKTAAGVSAGDVDGDGRLEAVFGSASVSSPTSPMVQADTERSLSVVLELPSSKARAVLIDDIDEDGFDDLVLTNWCAGTTCLAGVYWGSAQGLSEDEVWELPTLGAVAVAVGDVDQDGHKDIAFAAAVGADGLPDGESLLYYGFGHGFHNDEPVVFPTTGAQGVDIGDIDRDGDMDIVFAEVDGLVIHPSASPSRETLLAAENATGVVVTPGARLPAVQPDMNKD